MELPGVGSTRSAVQVNTTSPRWSGVISVEGAVVEGGGIGCGHSTGSYLYMGRGRGRGFNDGFSYTQQNNGAWSNDKGSSTLTTTHTPTSTMAPSTEITPLHLGLIVFTCIALLVPMSHQSTHPTENWKLCRSESRLWNSRGLEVLGVRYK